MDNNNRNTFSSLQKNLIKSIIIGGTRNYCYVLMMIVVIIIFQNVIGIVESLTPLENVGSWKCKSSTSELVGKLESKYEIYKNPKLPSVECENVIIPDYTIALPVAEFFHVEDYPTIVFPENGDMKFLDVCQTFKIVEERDNLTCTDLCEKYQYDSTLFDFINYCKYCSNASGYKKFNERIEDKNCKNSNSTIRAMVENFPTDMRYCGYSNFGLPIISPFLGFSYLCYCAVTNTYGMGCKKKALTNFIHDFTAYSGIVSFSILALFIFFFSLVPKVINLLYKNRDRNQYSIMRLLPTLAIFFATVLRVMSFITELNFWIEPFRYIATISEFVNYFALVPILVYLYGVMKYVKTQKRPNSILSYSLVISVFIILLLCCVLITVIFQLTLGPVYMIIGWISISWATEFLIHTACSIFLVVIYVTLKKITDISTTSTKYFRLGAISIGILQVFTSVDLNLLAAKITDELALYAFLRSCAMILSFTFALLVFLYEFNKGDFEFIVEKFKKSNEKDVSLLSTSNDKEESTTIATNAISSDYYSSESYNL